MTNANPKNPTKIDHATEVRLIESLKTGDQGAFDVLYHAYKRMIIRHVFYLLRSDELAEDVVQDTFITIWEHRNQLVSTKSFRSFLLTIASNKCYDLFKRAANDARLRRFLLPSFQQGVNQVDVYIRKIESREQLDQLLNEMPPKQREVFRLAKVEGLSYREISAKLGISRNTINTHLKRARIFLRQYLPENQDLFLLCVLIWFDIFLS